MSEVPKSVTSREAWFGGVRVRLHYLDDGQRLIEAEDMIALAKKMENGSLPIAEARRAIAWIKGDA